MLTIDIEASQDLSWLDVRMPWNFLKHETATVIGISLIRNLAACARAIEAGNSIYGSFQSYTRI